MAYKDPNYDPQKAHEYYEKHKKLKGRKKKGTSTKGFSEKQNEQLSYAQAQLKKQQKKKNAQARHNIALGASDKKETITRTRQEQKKRLIKEASEKIDALKKQYENASPEEQDAMREKISNAILNIRESAKARVGNINQKESEEKARVTRQAYNQTQKALAKNQKGYEKAEEKAKKKIKSGK